MFNFNPETSVLDVSMPDVADPQDLVLRTDVWASFPGNELHGVDLKINGRHSLLMGYVIAARLKNICKSISVYDTRSKSYVVVFSLNHSLKAGDLIQE